MPGRRLCWALAVLAAGALLVAIGLDRAAVRGVSYTWLLIGPLPFYLVAIAAFWRRPDNIPVRWLVLGSSAFVLETCLGDSLLYAVADTWPSQAVTVVAMARQWASLGSAVGFVGLLATFPSGRTTTRAEQLNLRVAVWTGAALPLVNALSATTLLPGLYAGDQEPAVPSPLVIDALAWLGPVSAVLYRAFPLWTVASLVLLARRARHADTAEQRPIRWLLVGWGAAAVATLPPLLLVWVSDGVADPVAATALVISWPLTLLLTLGTLLAALFDQGVLGVDRPTRRRFAATALRLVIGGALLVAAVAAGILAGRWWATPMAAAVAAVVTAAAVPLGRRLVRAGDRLVFGARLGSYETLADFSRVLAASRGSEDLLDGLAAALHRGLGVEWVTVDVVGAASGPHRVTRGRPQGASAAVVPIEYAGERVGTVACGPRWDGPLLAEDRRLLAAMAAQAGAAATSVRLASDLADQVAVGRAQAAELAASRQRVVHAQDAERRRIQRDLHDGVQQQVVALGASLSLARERMRRGDPRSDEAMAEAQRQVGALLDDVRAVAHSIHPPVLADRGLLEAVEAQAARLPVPVAVSADPGLRETRFAPEVESAAWFSIAEALSNAVKHADASLVVVTLEQRDGHLAVTVSDDGHGFDPVSPRGLGLTSLADRLDTVGGVFTVDSAAGSGTSVRLRVPVSGGAR